MTNNIEKELESFDIEFKPDVIVIRVFLEERKKSRLDKRNNHCKEYTKVESYDDCLKNAVSTNMEKSTFRCSLPGKNSLIKS